MEWCLDTPLPSSPLILLSFPRRDGGIHDVTHDEEAAH